MIAALRPVPANFQSLGFALVGALGAAVVIGAALLQRGPDVSYAPHMAAFPVELSDGRALYVQRFEVTIEEWNACHTQGACAFALRVRPDHDPKTVPATGLNYDDAQDYVRWVNDETGHRFRLPTAQEWATIAAPVLPEKPDPIFTDPDLNWASSYLIEGNTSRALRPQGSFATTAQGISDLDGSVWEWTSECYSGSADPSRCPAYFVGGEHVAAIPFLVRDPARGGCAVGTPPAHLGMRLVSDTEL